MTTLDIVVLVLFAVVAAVGVGSHPRGNVTASDWLNKIHMWRRPVAMLDFPSPQRG